MTLNTVSKIAAIGIAAVVAVSMDFWIKFNPPSATLGTFAFADDAKPTDEMTVNECMNIMAGLNALRFKGAQLLDQRPVPPDAAQYKLGAARMAVALNIAALNVVANAANKAQNDFLLELAPVPTGVDPAARVQLDKEREKKINDNWTMIMNGPCNARLVHFKEKDLKVGDGPDENAYPVNVLSSLIPIIDR
jgi:chemotaxis response regulator CheB